MADYEQKEMTGGLWKNPKKEQGDKRPNMTGNILVDGRKLIIRAWTNEGKNGRWQSIAAKWDDGEKNQRGPLEHSEPKSLAQELDDDIPF